MFLTNLELTHPEATDLVDKEVLCAARSLIPGSFSDVDRTMEENFIKFANGSGIEQKTFAFHFFFSDVLSLGNWS